MLRKIILTLCALLLTVLPALAEEAVPAITLHEDVLLLQAANNALTDQYGHTRATLGLFEAELHHCGDTVIVTYVSNGSVDASLTGEYFVIISGEQVQALWTHDAVDTSLWQAGDLNSPAWGVKQLTAYLDEHPYTRNDFCTPYVKDFGVRIIAEDVNPDNRQEAAQARQLATAAVQAMYSLTDEETAALTWIIDMCGVLNFPETEDRWIIMLQNDDVIDPTGYYVTLNPETGMIYDISVSTGGVG